MLYIIISHFISRSLNIPGYFQFINEISINLRKSPQISVNLRNLRQILNLQKLQGFTNLVHNFYACHTPRLR